MARCGFLILLFLALVEQASGTNFVRISSGTCSKLDTAQSKFHRVTRADDCKASKDSSCVLPQIIVSNTNSPFGCFCSGGKLYNNVDLSATKACNFAQKCICKETFKKEAGTVKLASCSMKFANGTQIRSTVEDTYLDCPCCKKDGTCGQNNRDCWLDADGWLGWVIASPFYLLIFVCMPCYKCCIPKSTKYMENLGLGGHRTFGNPNSWRAMALWNGRFYSGVKRIKVGWPKGKLAARFLDGEDKVVFSCGDDVGSNAEEWALQMDEYIESITQNHNKLEFETNKHATKVFECETKDVSETFGRETSPTVFKAAPSNMIVGLTLAAPPVNFDKAGSESVENGGEEGHLERSIQSIVGVPVTPVYSTKEKDTRGGILKKKRKVVRTLAMESMVVLIDVISLLLVWVAFSPDRAGWVSFHPEVIVANITSCIPNWETEVKPCLLSQPDTLAASQQQDRKYCCGCGHVMNYTRLTFAFHKSFDKGKFDWCKKGSIGGKERWEKLSHCKLSGVTMLNPLTGGGILDTDAVIPLSTSLKMKPGHTHCVAKTDFDGVGYTGFALAWLSLWKICHILLEVCMIGSEISHHARDSIDEDDHPTSKVKEVLHKGLKSFGTLLITIPTNYMYNELLQYGTPLGTDCLSGDHSCTGGIFKTPSIQFLYISQICLIIFLTVNMGCGICCLNNGAAGTMPWPVLAFIFLSPYVAFEVMVIIQLFAKYQGKALTLYNLLMSINFTDTFTFDTSGIAVDIAGLRFTSNLFRYVVFLLHMHPENLMLLRSHLRFLRAHFSSTTKVAEHGRKAIQMGIVGAEKQGSDAMKNVEDSIADAKEQGRNTAENAKETMVSTGVDGNQAEIADYAKAAKDTRKAIDRKFTGKEEDVVERSDPFAEARDFLERDWEDFRDAEQDDDKKTKFVELSISVPPELTPGSTMHLDTPYGIRSIFVPPVETMTDNRIILKVYK